jgi:hypothetical protein
MNNLPNLRPWIAILLAGGVIVPIAICVVFGLGTLLTAMGDSSGGMVLSRISLSLVILWVLDLIVLILFQGLSYLLGNPKNDDQSDDSGQ